MDGNLFNMAGDVLQVVQEARDWVKFAWQQRPACWSTVGVILGDIGPSAYYIVQFSVVFFSPGRF